MRRFRLVNALLLGTYVPTDWMENQTPNQQLSECRDAGPRSKEGGKEYPLVWRKNESPAQWQMLQSRGTVVREICPADKVIV
jgi:hypothetical protein